MSCNERCWCSTSTQCKCSCGGKNHGEGMMRKEMIKIEKSFPPCTPVRMIWKKHTKQAISLGETFLFKGEIRLGVTSQNLEYWWPLSQIEKVNGEEPKSGKSGNRRKTENSD